MTLTNKELIALIQALGEVKALDLLTKKIEDDDARREYHRKYNAAKNETLREIKKSHPELFRRVATA